MIHHDSVFDFADWLIAPPSGGPLQKWFVGIGLAVLTTGYGLYCCVTRRAITLNLSRGYRAPDEFLWLELTGIPALTLGLLITCIGLFLHFQWFWGNHRRLVRYHEIGKFAAGVGAVAALLAHVVSLVFFT
ncbi:hypothetical protein [Candidatus Laterigemmans baculatus]|uniref:hypothetical protein n=1 Tax=Candidatus Laterigemmans baculatus TaxID=2770505 RepID=UPI0013DCB9B6|nr:hypothetical protein [Candidatus Laterigemmans baculatus]